MNILISACLLGACCRYDGNSREDLNVRKLMEKNTLIPVCPEQLGGLATPREPAERRGGQVFTQSGSDVTSQYRHGAEETLKLCRLFGCTVAVLKERSPSCGRGTVYDGTFTHTLTEGDGVTAELLKKNGIRVIGESEIEKELL